jgi:hypothetical protein
MIKIYAAIRGHALPLFNVGFGFFNLFNALDAQTIPAPVLILIGAGGLFVGGFGVAMKLARDRHNKEWGEVMEITERLIQNHASLAAQYATTAHLFEEHANPGRRPNVH